MIQFHRMQQHPYLDLVLMGNHGKREEKVDVGGGENISAILKPKSKSYYMLPKVYLANPNSDRDYAGSRLGYFESGDIRICAWS